MTSKSIFPGSTRDLDRWIPNSRGAGSSPGKRLVLASVFLLAACGNAADMPVAAPGDDIVEGDVEGVVAVEPAPVAVAAAPVEASPDTDIFGIEKDSYRADFFREDSISLGMDSDDVEPLLQAWLDTADVETTSLRTSFREDGRTVLIATREGLKDDAVSAEQVYAEFTPIGPLSNNLDFIGLRQRCSRGARAGEWTTELCP